MDVLATLTAALRGGPVHSSRLLRLHTALGPDVLVAEALDGHECLDGDGFRFTLTAVSLDAHIELTGLLGQPVLIELRQADGTYRPLHGHVTVFERIGSNGGLARYRLVVEPWLALLRQRVDSYVFQDLTVVEIVESVLSDYVGQGALAPSWRWDLKDASVYRKRSVLTQYEESDLAFVQRVLAEEGIHTHFEHSGEVGSETLGSHTLVLADHTEAFAEAGSVRYHRNDATEQSDSVQGWTTARRWQPQQIKRASWDYRTLDLRSVEAGTGAGDVSVIDADVSGPYAYPDRATGERYARQHLEALQVESDTVRGEGTWRAQAAGSRFALGGHYAYADDNRFTCLRVTHHARNNLGAQVWSALEQQLGRIDAPVPALPGALSGLGIEPGLEAPIAQASAVEGYTNTFEAIPERVPYRPRTVDGHGLRLHPKPTVHGTQTAIVVSDGAPLQTDRDHRIKVQFHWQRGANAGNRQNHPAGEDNAPGTASAWTWVRVAGVWAGDNWGSVLLPRQGQEVVVAFLEGDIDRPVVIGTVYNGAGQADAAHNQVNGGAAGATGNAAAWFEGNEHGAVFTGFKTQALSRSQDGSGGYQQLRLDDTPGQGRAQASTTHQASALTLGHLKGGTDNVRGAERGFGAELTTQAGGAIRAGAGLLLTTEPGQQQLTAPVAQGQLGQAEQLVQSLAQAAKNQQATLPKEADELSAQTALKTTQATLSATQTGTAPGEGIQGGEGSAPGWDKPALVASSPKGIVSVTATDQVWVSGTQTVVTAGQDLQWLSQGSSVVAVAGGIGLYTQGAEGPSGKPNQERGIALHAAQGKVSARAHQNVAKVQAQKRVTIASTQADINIAAPTKHVLLTAAGAYLKLEGGNIELGAPGTIEFKGSQRNWTTPKGAATQASLPKGALKACAKKDQSSAAKGAATL